MRRIVRLILLVILLIAGAVALGNSSLWVSPQTKRTLLAHRGLAQTYPATGLTATTCTAARIVGAGIGIRLSIRHCEEHLRRSNPFFLCLDRWIASLRSQ